MSLFKKLVKIGGKAAKVAAIAIPTVAVVAQAVGQVKAEIKKPKAE